MVSKKFKTALVLGGGAFGTSMASVLANNFERVIIMVRSEDVYNCMETWLRRNPSLKYAEIVNKLDSDLGPDNVYIKIKIKNGTESKHIVQENKDGTESVWNVRVIYAYRKQILDELKK